MSTNASLNRKLRMGLVGGGQGAFIGRVHSIAGTLDNRAVLVAGALSSDPAKAKASAPDYDIPVERAYGSYKEMVDGESNRKGNGIDFVTVATPNHTHFEIAKTFAEAGFNVICDKPLTLDLAQAEELLKVVEKSGVVFAVTLLGLRPKPDSHPESLHVRFPPDSVQASFGSLALWMTSVILRCHSTSRHIPTNCGPQKFEVAMAAQTPLDAAERTPCPITSQMNTPASVSDNASTVKKSTPSGTPIPVRCSASRRQRDGWQCEPPQCRRGANLFIGGRPNRLGGASLSSRGRRVWIRRRQRGHHTVCGRRSIKRGGATTK
jgi:hypothetical protein